MNIECKCISWNGFECVVCDFTSILFFVVFIRLFLDRTLNGAHLFRTLMHRRAWIFISAITTFSNRQLHRMHPNDTNGIVDERPP